MSRHIEPSELELPPPLAAREFQQIRELAYRTFGLDLKAGKEELVSARLRRLVRSGGFRRFEDYYRSVLSDTTGAGLAAMIDALATNHTSFFREPDHFEFLRSDVLPRLPVHVPVEIWSAACSTGEEVWTLAMVLQEAPGCAPFHITASDISQKALAFAAHGVYPVERCHGLSSSMLARYFTAESPTKSFRVAQPLRCAASFHRVNLLEEYPWPRRFPVIFCRNVMIYFDRPTKNHVVRQLTASLQPGGYLFVGHAESLTGVEHALQYVRPAVYRKPQEGGSWIKS